jgi:AAHS family 4-hydroxybenzoate transporter-like MFS transporter
MSDVTANATATHEHGLREASDIPNALRWRVILLCALVCLVDGYDMTVAPVTIPLMAADWGMAPQAFTVALAASVLGMGLGAAFIAPLGDRFGRRPVILGSLILIGLASLAVCLTKALPIFVLLRLMIGIGLGASVSNSIALTSEYALPHLRSRVVTLVYGMAAVGGGVGGFVAPWIMGPLGWDGIYIVSGSGTLLLVPILFLGLAESIRFLQLRNAARMAVASVEAAASALDGLRKLVSPSYRGASVLLWTLNILSAFVTYLISSWIPTIMSVAGWSMTHSAYAASAYSLGGVFGGYLLGWLVDKKLIKFALALGFGATGLSLAALLVVPPIVPVWLMFITIMSAGNVGATYAMAAIATHVYPTPIRASGVGAFGAMGRVSATLAPLAGGLLLALGFSALQILTFLIIPMAMAFVIVLVFAGILARQAKEI